MFENIEMAVVLGHATVQCPLVANHRPELHRVAPCLTLEHLHGLRMSEDDVSKRLQVGQRVGAGGFSHIYTGKLRTDLNDPEAEPLLVAVKQYIQRKPIFFSFDTEEERAAKLKEMEQGAVVVFRRLQHEVRMLTAKDHLKLRARDEGDAQRLLSLTAFSLKPPYVKTRYYEFGDLYRMLHNTYAFPKMNPIWVIGAAIDVARGMRYLHSCNPPLCHRGKQRPPAPYNALTHAQTRTTRAASTQQATTTRADTNGLLVQTSSRRTSTSHRWIPTRSSAPSWVTWARSSSCMRASAMMWCR